MIAMRVIVVALIAALLHAPAATAENHVDETTRLAALAKTWGLLKYYSASAVTRRVDWDATLVEAIPRVRAADTKDAFNAEILRLVSAAGDRPRFDSIAIARRAKLDDLFRWIDDPSLFDDATMASLKAIRYGDVPGLNPYVSTVSTNNADFSGEAPYASPEYPEVEFRLLALFRFWNMIQYFFPNRGLMDRDWNEVLADAVPRFVGAADVNAYHLAVAALTASINDTHAFTSSAVIARYWGLQTAPIEVRYIESRTVVTRILSRLVEGADVRTGDVVVAIDGVTIEAARARVRPYATGSNSGSLEENVSAMLVRTRGSEMRLTIERDGVLRDVVLWCPPYNDVASAWLSIEDRAVYRILPGNIGYVNMGMLQPADVTQTMTALRNTAGIIFDQRNYPNETIWDIMRFLLPGPKPFVRMTMPDLTMPGAFKNMYDQVLLSGSPLGSPYSGRVIVLADERTISQAEYTCMAFRTAPNATIVGSPTSGADGTVSFVYLPGGVKTAFSGLGVFYPDGTPTQRVGIVPDVLVKPTRAGIAAGRDEVLEAALALVR